MYQFKMQLHFCHYEHIRYHSCVIWLCFFLERLIIWFYFQAKFQELDCNQSINIHTHATINIRFMMEIVCFSYKCFSKLSTIRCNVFSQMVVSNANGKQIETHEIHELYLISIYWECGKNSITNASTFFFKLIRLHHCNILHIVRDSHGRL